jgi:hypothetical protein
MNPRSNLQDRLANYLAAHALWVAAPDDAEWTRAMIHEQEHLPADTSALSWALGCVLVGYLGRFRAMTRLSDFPRWFLLADLLLCLGPACACLIFVAVSTAQGYSPLAGTSYTVTQEGLFFGSAALIGPLGLAAAFWTLSSAAHRLGKGPVIALWLLTAWTLTVYLGLLTLLLLHAHFRGTAIMLWLGLFLPFALLPTLAVAQLQRLNTRERSSLALAGS